MYWSKIKSVSQIFTDLQEVKNMLNILSSRRTNNKHEEHKSQWPDGCWSSYTGSTPVHILNSVTNSTGPNRLNTSGILLIHQCAVFLAEMFTLTACPVLKYVCAQFIWVCSTGWEIRPYSMKCTTHWGKESGWNSTVLLHTARRRWRTLAISPEENRSLPLLLPFSPSTEFRYESRLCFSPLNLGGISL